MYQQHRYPFAMLNPVQQWFWEHGGEDPDWGQISQPHDLERASWRAAGRALISAVVVKDIANRTKNKELLNCANSAIDALLDEFCGTPPRRKWPFPGPPPQVLQMVSELSLLANSLQSGGLRSELEDVSTKLLMRNVEPSK